jgi:hypothetical protein
VTHCADGIKPHSPVHAALLRKFAELAFDESAEMRWQKSRAADGDDIDVGPVTGTDLQNDLMEASRNPF